MKRAMMPDKPQKYKCPLCGHIYVHDADVPQTGVWHYMCPRRLKNKNKPLVEMIEVLEE